MGLHMILGVANDDEDNSQSEGLDAVVTLEFGKLHSLVRPSNSIMDRFPINNC